MCGAVGPDDGDARGRPGQVEVGSQLFGPHHRVRPAIGLANGDGHLRNIGLDNGVEEPAAALDDAVLLLLHTGQEAGGVDDEHQGHVERVAEPYETRSLVRGLNVDRPRHHHRLVGDHADRPAVDAGETGDHRLTGLGGDVKEVTVIEDPQQNVVHIVGGVVSVRHDAVEFEIFRCNLWFQSRVDYRRIVKCVGRQELQEFAYIGEGVLFGVHDLVDVSIPGLIVSAAELI